jgi:hypothetical protein
MLAAIIATPAMAQEVPQEPGADLQGSSVGERLSLLMPTTGPAPSYTRTTCGLQPGATYLGPDGRWYPC